MTGSLQCFFSENLVSPILLSTIRSFDCPDLTKRYHYCVRVGENIAVNWCIWPQLGMYIFHSASASIKYLRSVTLEIFHFLIFFECVSPDHISAGFFIRKVRRFEPRCEVSILHDGYWVI